MKTSFVVAFVITAIYIEATFGALPKKLVENKSISAKLTVSKAKPTKIRCFKWCTRKSPTKYLLPSCYYYRRQRRKYTYYECRYCRRKQFCLGTTKYLSRSPPTKSVVDALTKVKPTVRSPEKSKIAA